MEQIKKIFNKFRKSQLFFPIVAWALLLLYNLIFTKDFLSIEIIDRHLVGSMIDIFKRGAPLVLLSMGVTMVIATRGTDISVGSVVAISAMVCAYLIGGERDVTKVPLFVAIGASLLVSASLGLWNGFLVAKLGIQPIVATMILMTAGRGIAQLISEGLILSVYYKPFYVIGSGFFLGLPVAVYIAGAVFLLLMILVHKTAFGMFLKSVGYNRVASRYTGLNVDRIILICYTISGFCAGLAGLIISSEVKSADANNAGLYLELDAILSSAMAGNSMAGGKFSVPASVIGALVIQTLTTTIYASGVAPEVTMVVKAIIVMLICIIQSPQFNKLALGKFISRKEGAQYEENTVKL